jgi:hypothetical protein
VNGGTAPTDAPALSNSGTAAAAARAAAERAAAERAAAARAAAERDAAERDAPERAERELASQSDILVLERFVAREAARRTGAAGAAYGFVPFGISARRNGAEHPSADACAAARRHHAYDQAPPGAPPHGTGTAAEGADGDAPMSGDDGDDRSAASADAADAAAAVARKPADSQSVYYYAPRQLRHLVLTGGSRDKLP